MRIAYNPKSAEPLKVAPSGVYLNAITFDLSDHTIYARGEAFKGTDTTYEVFKKHTTSGDKGGSNGLVPVPSYTTTNTRFLREDGTWEVPTDSHYTTHLYVGNKSTGNGNNNSNSTTSNRSTYIKLFDNTTLRHQYLISGSGPVKVSSDASGNIIIDSESNNFYRPIAINGTDILGNDNNTFNLIQQGAIILTPQVDADSKYTGGVTISASEATQSAAGLLSAEDKKKLDGMVFSGPVTGGDGFSGVLADAFTTIKLGTTTIVAGANKQILTFKQGNGIALSLDTTDYSLSIAGNNMTGASASKNGTLGFVPAPTKGKEKAYLRGDATWTVLATNQIYSLDGYAISTEVENLTTTDTLNVALGKLEYKADLGVLAYNIITAAYDGDGTIENLNEILKVLEGISDTDTVLAIIGLYLPLTGGTLTGYLTILNSGGSTATPYILFQRGTTSDSSNDWKLLVNSSGTFIISKSSSGASANILTLTSSEAAITGKLSVSGATTLSSTLTVTGATTINNTLTVKGNILPLTTNTYNLGNSGNIWANVYSNLGTFNDNVTAKGFIKTGSTNNKVLLGGGGDKAISDFLLKSESATQELSNNLTSYEKTLTLTQDWLDTGISGANLDNGTYIIQVTVNGGNMSECYWSGVMSWYKGTCSDTESDEIILHRSGKSYSDTIYLRTIMQSSGVLKLLIAADENLSASYKYTFKFKRMI